MKLTLLLIPLILLSSCTIDWHDEKDKKIASLNAKIETQKEEIKKVKDDELFKKNKECSKKELGDTDGFNNHEVFYSPKNRSCIFIGTLIVDENTPDEQVNGLIIDSITNETLVILSYKNDKIIKFTNYTSSSLSNLSVNEARCIFNKKVKDLKQRDDNSTGNYFQGDENCN